MKKSTLMLTAVLICIAGAASDAAVITWTDPIPVSSASDVRADGALIEAVNGYISGTPSSVTTTSPTVNGVAFTGTKDFLDSDTTMVFDCYSGDTGDSGYNDLLSTLDFGGGGTKFTKSLGGGNLVSGNDYLIQIWFVDDRPGYDTRVMEYGDGNGNTVQLTSGDVTYAIGTFTADGTTQDLTFDAIGFGNAHITAYQIRKAGRGAAHSPLPDGADIVDPTVYSSVSWYNAEQDENGDFLDDPNIVSIDGYDVWWSAGVEPNYLTDTPTYQAAPDQDYTPTPAITYDTTYYWRVDSYVTWDSNDFTGTASLSSVVQGLPWSFTTEVEDKVPVVTLSNYVTWPEELPDDIVADVNDYGEDDIATVDWEITAGQGIPVPADMQMQNRGTDNIKPPYEPNLYRDYIGTDLKTEDTTSNVLNLTLSGLPSGSYTWKSYHYDEFRYLGTLPLPTFDVTVTDSTGAATTTDVPQSNGDTDIFPPAAFTTSITSDGSDVTLQFVGPADYRALADAGDPNKHGGLFAMNAFELTGSGDPLYVDFGSDPNFVQSGYQEYFATKGDPETFTAQSFSAFGTMVTVQPDWDAPGLEITSYSGTTPTSTATVDTTDAPYVLGTYTIKATATENGDDGNEPQADSGTTTINVVEDACTAAQLLSGFEFNSYDVDENCIVNLVDFAAFAAEWLDDASLSGPTAW